MDAADYYRSLSQEITALQNRVRFIISNQHWQTDGEWKESVLRTVLRRHLPSTLAVGRGFIITQRRPSTQIDVIIYDTTYPLLHQDGDLIFVTPDAVRAIIEVKSTIGTSDVAEVLSKLADNAELLPEGAKKAFVGLFAFNEQLGSSDLLFRSLRMAAGGTRRRAVNHLCLGPSRFVRFWTQDPFLQFQLNAWRSYHVDELAYGYFLFNALEQTVGQTVRDNLWAWFPRDGKEALLQVEEPFKLPG
jgi:hypothetical protein